MMGPGEDYATTWESYFMDKYHGTTMGNTVVQSKYDNLDLLFQGFLDVEGTLQDANPRSLAAIRCTLADVAGQPFWATPWFAGTEGAPEAIRQAIIFGSVMASFTVEAFSLDRLKILDYKEIEERFRSFKRLTHFEDIGAGL